MINYSLQDITLTSMLCACRIRETFKRYAMLPGDYREHSSVIKPHQVNVTTASLDITLRSSSAYLTNSSYGLFTRHASAYSTLTSQSLSSEIQRDVPLLSGLNRNEL